MTDRIVYLCCKANGELDVDEDGSVYGTVCATVPPSVLRAYVLADELDRANQRIAKEEEVELAYSCCGA